MEIKRFQSEVKPPSRTFVGKADKKPEIEIPADSYSGGLSSPDVIAPALVRVKAESKPETETGSQAVGRPATEGPSRPISNPTTLLLEEPSPLQESTGLDAPGGAYRKTIDSLTDFIDSAVAKGAKEGTGTNEPRADIFKDEVESLWQTLNSEEMKRKAASDPYLKPLLTQTISSLKHVRLDFERRDENYVHDDVVKGPYPFAPTLKAVTNVRNFYRVLDGGEAGEVKASATPGQIQSEVAELESNQKAYIRGITEEPLKYYEDFRARLTKDGQQAPFPEFSDMVRYLELHMDKEGPLKEAGSNKHLAVARQIALENLEKVKEGGYPYGDTIEAVQGSLAFLDIYERGRPGSEARPNLYHGHRYQYYTHFIKNETPDHVLFPTIYGLGATDLLKTRGVPIGFVGVPPEVSWVDGYTQTPLEFFYHDINHVRRMWQFTKEHAAEMGKPLPEFIRESNRYMKEDVLPVIKIDKTDSPEVKNEKRMMKLILFEALHEDALPAHPAVLKKSLERAPNTLTPFEELIHDEKTVRYLMEPGATTLAYVYRKAAGMFYDMPSMRMDYIVGADYRTQDFVAESAKSLNKKLHLGVDEKLIDAYTRDDTGMPDDFRFQLEQQLQEDPDRMAPLHMKEDPSLAGARRG